ncbi:MAG: 50S ribosomal protein L6 [Bacteroidales bacterium]|nr:50S ribosomal protein L6 [Bacteroidales bacterium]
MSRIGKLPIVIPQGVEIKNDNNIVTVKGKLGELTQELHPDITIEIADNQLLVKRPSDSRQHSSMHGLYRSLLNNMVQGVSEGYTTVLELVGVGYKATVNAQQLEMSLGFSHDLLFELPEEVQAEVLQEKRANPVLTLKSYDKQLLGQVVAKIRSYRPPEPYKGKGIKFKGEEIRRKQGKTASK